MASAVRRFASGLWIARYLAGRQARGLAACNTLASRKNRPVLVILPKQPLCASCTPKEPSREPVQAADSAGCLHGEANSTARTQGHSVSASSEATDIVPQRID